MINLLRFSHIASYCLILIIIFYGTSSLAQGIEIDKNRPTYLSINFLTHADQVFLNGYVVNTPLYQAVGRNETFQFTEIAQKQPFFGWVVNSAHNNVLQ